MAKHNSEKNLVGHIQLAQDVVPGVSKRYYLGIKKAIPANTVIMFETHVPGGVYVIPKPCEYKPCKETSKVAESYKGLLYQVCPVHARIIRRQKKADNNV